ncbi:hypothetical protein [Aminobacter niigataensis]|uniref:hypothetical protein n=1 Tax=Aminobacter niigataensis TaxID=83265 RepID=UPI0024C800CC|nr:protein of unknown function [Aminobacter niigataensis]
MSYRIESLPTQQLFGPAMQATEALVRLDERIARSPVAKGLSSAAILPMRRRHCGSMANWSMSRTSCCTMRIWTGAPRRTN